MAARCEEKWVARMAGLRLGHRLSNFGAVDQLTGDANQSPSTLPSMAMPLEKCQPPPATCWNERFGSPFHLVNLEPTTFLFFPCSDETSELERMSAACQESQICRAHGQGTRLSSAITLCSSLMSCARLPQLLAKIHTMQVHQTFPVFLLLGPCRAMRS